MRMDSQRSDVVWRQVGPVIHVTLNRPDHHNALTAQMYETLLAVFKRAEQASDVRVMVLRGAGGRAFAAGSDIAQFAKLRNGTDGAAYEAKMSEVLDRLETLAVCTVAVIEGHCVGAGLLLAAACDVRVSEEDARFALPVARTLGNCLSANSLSLLADRLGSARLLDLLATTRTMSASEVRGAGFLSRVVPRDDLEEEVADLLEDLSCTAPLTIWSAKEILHRVRVSALPDDRDVLTRVYESKDFKSGVQGFLAKQRTAWTGR